jgi:hypothetical protein
MDGITGLSILLNIATLAFVVVILSSSGNRRRAAAWLLASAQAQDEIRKAKHAIRIEQKISQGDLEDRFTGRDRALSQANQPVEP